MDDDGVEEILSRYRPADPPADLLNRITSLHAEPHGRSWPWAVAAAALLATALTLYGGSVVAPSLDPTSEAANHEMSELSKRLGDEAGTRDVTDWIVRIERARPEAGR